MKRVKTASVFLALCLILSGCFAQGPAEAPAAAPEPTALPTPTGTPLPTPEVYDPEILRFSHESGTYDETTLTVTVSAPEGYTVAFTTDGTVPGIEDDTGLASVDITLEKTSGGYLYEHRELMRYTDYPDDFIKDDGELPSGRVLTICMVDESGALSSPETRVYFLGVDFSERFPGCLVFSICTDPENLVGYEQGILAVGAVYDEWLTMDESQRKTVTDRRYKYPTNFTQRGRDWERPCTVQIYDGGASPAAELGAGIRIQGGYSRNFYQKSFNLYFRKLYGSANLVYPLFDDTGVFGSLTLRNGGNGAQNVKFRNSLFMELASELSMLSCHYRPAVLFLNGEFWGPYMLSEKLSGQMIADRCGVDEDQVVIIKAGKVEVGEEEDVLLYDELYSYAKKDLRDPDVYRQFCELVNVSDMAEYFALRIYIGDIDWVPSRNHVMWRTRDGSFDDGRWQFILYDLEYSAGLYNQKNTSAQYDHFNRVLEKFPLFASAVRNDEFFELFRSAIKRIGSEYFSVDRVRESMDAFSAEWDPLMPYYYLRFHGNPDSYMWGKESIIGFFEERYDLIIPIIENYATKR